MTCSCNDWWKQQQKQHGRAVVVRDGCELQRISYVLFHLWILQTCQYKHGESPAVLALSIRKIIFSLGEQYSAGVGYSEKLCNTNPWMFSWFHDLARQITTDLLSLATVLLLSGCSNRHLQRSLLNLHFYEAMSLDPKAKLTNHVLKEACRVRGHGW